MKQDSVLTHMKGEPHKLAMKLEHESGFMKQPGPCCKTTGKFIFLVEPAREREGKEINLNCICCCEGRSEDGNKGKQIDR